MKVFSRDNLRVARKAAGMRQADLAGAVGCSRGYMGEVERGESQPSMALTEAIAKALGVEADSLMVDAPDPEPPTDNPIVNEILRLLGEMTPAEHAESLAGILRLIEQREREEGASPKG